MFSILFLWTTPKYRQKKFENFWKTLDRNKILNKKCPDQINKIHTWNKLGILKKWIQTTNFRIYKWRDPDKEIDNDFIYETDNSGDEWFNETISEELDDAFTRLISKSKDKDVWKTEGRPKIIPVLQQEHFVEIKAF